MIAYAQSSPASFGIKAGVNVSNFSGDGAKEADGKIGFTAGITFDYILSDPFFMRTGLEFAMKGAKYKKGEVDITVNPMYIQLPIHAGYKLPLAEGVNCSIHAGPYLAYGIAGKIKPKTITPGMGSEDEETDFFGNKEDGGNKKFDFGMGLGMGVEFGRFEVGVGYDLGLVNISRDNDAKLRTMNAYLALGCRF